MSDRQRLPLIERKPKAVHVLSGFRDLIGLARRPDLAGKLIQIRSCIVNGSPLPSGCYRKGADDTVDALLEKEGIMHLHLGRQNTAELLWLIQYPDRVVLLEVSGHSHFATVPPGAALKRLYGGALRLHEAKHTETIEKSARELRDAVRRGLAVRPREPRK